VNLTPIDLIIVVVVALAALAGVGLGLLRALGSAASAALTVALMLLGYEPLAAFLRRRGELAPLAATLLAFAALAVLGQLGGFVLIQRPLGAVLAWRDRSRWPRRLDAALGALPGAALGLVVVGLLLVPLTVALPGRAIGPAIRQARLAPRLLEVDARILRGLRVQPLLQPAVEALALSAPPARSEEARQLPFQVAAEELAPDPAAEEALLALVNGERERAGLPALAPEGALVPIARAHAVEMFAQGYFAHESPATGSPFDRLDAAGVAYLAAGENLAYAPAIEIAHRGLMASPGHRANILSPAFGRAGIGIVRSEYYGLMIVQVFRD
jgi:uncharacterized protein YkwD/uncharacterized membrane protein required for colicin V production